MSREIGWSKLGPQQMIYASGVVNLQKMIEVDWTISDGLGS
jgi:hypothetical protein